MLQYHILASVGRGHGLCESICKFETSYPIQTEHIPYFFCVRLSLQSMYVTIPDDVEVVKDKEKERNYFIIRAV